MTDITEVGTLEGKLYLCVMAFFLTMLYNNFAHGFYRRAALFKYYFEVRKETKSK